MSVPRWIVWTLVHVNGTHWHVLPTRKDQRQFAKEWGGTKYELKEVL